MAKLRLVFAKEGRAVYLSHLDLLRTFQRVFLRRGLVLRHSQGFHPHPILSFALPLPLGQSSACEILDFEVVEELDGSALPDVLNPYMPEGIRALSCAPPVRPVRELERLRARAELVYDGGVPAEAAEKLRALLTGESVVIQIPGGRGYPPHAPHAGHPGGGGPAVPAGGGVRPEPGAEPGLACRGGGAVSAGAGAGFRPGPPPGGVGRRRKSLPVN